MLKHLFCTCVLLIHYAQAAPFLERFVEKAIETVKEVFTPETKDQILASLSSRPLLDEQGLKAMKTSTVFSAIAYCDAAQIASWSCKLCQLPESNGSNNAKVFSSKAQVQGYVAVHEATSFIIVGFRGSSNNVNKLKNLQIDLIPSQDLFGGATDIEVHQGFLENYLSVRNEMTTLLKEATQKHPSFKILFTGHSLGGALATVAAVDVVRNAGISGGQVHLSTIGEPRIGNDAFVNAVKQCQFSASERGVNKADVVPHLPSSAVSNYRHRSGEVWTAFDDKTYKCQDDAGEDSECSKTLSLPLLNQQDHLTYYGMKIGGSACQ